MVPLAAVRRVPAAFRAPICLSALIERLMCRPGKSCGQGNNLAGIQLVDELSWTSLMPWIRSVSGANDSATAARWVFGPPGAPAAAQ